MTFRARGIYLRAMRRASFFLLFFLCAAVLFPHAHLGERGAEQLCAACQLERTPSELPSAPTLAPPTATLLWNLEFLERAAPWVKVDRRRAPKQDPPEDGGSGSLRGFFLHG